MNSRDNWIKFSTEEDIPVAHKVLANPNLWSTQIRSFGPNGNWISTNFEQYMLLPQYPIVEFGSGCGINLIRFRKTYDIIAWDFSPPALQFLKELPDAKKIKTRLKDLDAIEGPKDSPRLSYQSKLEKDLKTPANIFCTNTLKYLNPTARMLLLFSLINTAKSGSVFFLFSNCTVGLSEQETKKFKTELDRKSLDEKAILERADEESRLQAWILEKGKLPSYYILSFFGARTDCEVLHVSQISRQDDTSDLPKNCDYYREKLIIRKR